MATGEQAEGHQSNQHPATGHKQKTEVPERSFTVSLLRKSLRPWGPMGLRRWRGWYRWYYEETLVEPDKLKFVTDDGTPVAEPTIDDEGVWRVEKRGEVSFTPYEGFSGTPTAAKFQVERKSGDEAIGGKTPDEFWQKTELRWGWWAFHQLWGGSTTNDNRAAKVRHDGYSQRATFKTEGNEQTIDRFKIQSLLYTEILASWRQLTEVRFRVLNLLPAVSIVAFVPLVLLLSNNGRPPLVVGLLLSILGLTLTHGLHIYEIRNDGLYDDMISRARRIEHDLGIEHGLMMNRVKSRKGISHGRGVWLVFHSVKAAWLVVAVAMAYQLVTLDDPEPIRVDLPGIVEVGGDSIEVDVELPGTVMIDGESIEAQVQIPGIIEAPTSIPQPDPTPTASAGN